MKLAVLALAVMLSGCAARPIHPGAANKLDSNAYDATLLYHDAIESAKADVAAGSFPANAKPILNRLIDAYNVLDGAYKTYHAAALNGTDTAAMQQAVSDGISQAAAAFADLVKAYPKAVTK